MCTPSSPRGSRNSRTGEGDGGSGAATRPLDGIDQVGNGEGFGMGILGGEYKKGGSVPSTYRGGSTHSGYWEYCRSQLPIVHSSIQHTPLNSKFNAQNATFKRMDGAS